MRGRIRTCETAGPDLTAYGFTRRFNHSRTRSHNLFSEKPLNEGGYHASMPDLIGDDPAPTASEHSDENVFGAEAHGLPVSPLGIGSDGHSKPSK